MSDSAPSTSTSTSGPPRSWAEDLNSYRSTRGCQSFSSVGKAGGPARYPRTNLVPFADYRHPLYAYNDFVDGQGTLVRPDPHVAAERAARHGWGDVSLLKEDHPRSAPPASRQGGRAAVAPPCGKDGRRGLFGVLHGSEAGAPDAWVGHPLVDPGKGKRTTHASQDPKGRRDLFDVLHNRSPGAPADDCWLGNALIDPARGKAHAPGPEQTRGRRDLGEIFAMGILNDPRKAELLQRGADPLGDAWCGNPLIDPAKGKQAVGGSAAADSHLMATTFKDNAATTDFPRRHAKEVPPPAPDTVPALLAGTATHDDWGRATKRQLPDMPPLGLPFDGRKDMYAHLSYRPLSEVEQRKWGAAYDDAGVHRRHCAPAAPGSSDPAKGPDMLAWKPDVRMAQFVPRGGMAQENRVKGSTLRTQAHR